MASSTNTPMRTDSQGPLVTTLSVVFGVITIVVVFLRLFSRIFVVRHIGVDDVFIVLASLLAWAFIIATILAVKYGLGDHIEVVMAKGTIVTYSQVVWFSSIFYNACLGCIKTSVLCLYSRLGDKTLTRMAHVMMGIIACQAGANVLVCIFQCNPIPAAWDTSITKKTCVNINAFYLANAATNITTDLLTYGLPWNTVRKLQIPYKQKVAVGAMLCLGLFACISSIIRITMIPKMLTSPDATYVISGAMYWSVIETNIGILAASIPSMKPLVKKYLPKVLGEYTSSKDRAGGPSGSHTGHLHNKSGFSKLSGTTNTYNSNRPWGRSDLKDRSLTASVTAIDPRDNDDDEIELSGRHHHHHHHPSNNNHGISADNASSITAGGGDAIGRSTTSNSSEEYIIKPSTTTTNNNDGIINRSSSPPVGGGIMRTTEVTHTVEGGGANLPSAMTTTVAYGNSGGAVPQNGGGKW